MSKAHRCVIRPSVTYFQHDPETQHVSFMLKDSEGDTYIEEDDSSDLKNYSSDSNFAKLFEIILYRRINIMLWGT